MKYLPAIILSLLWCAQSHLFVGNLSRLHELDIDALIGDAPAGFSQPKVPCKGDRQGIDGIDEIPGATWQAGQDVTFQYVPNSCPSRMSRVTA